MKATFTRTIPAAAPVLPSLATLSAAVATISAAIAVRPGCGRDLAAGVSAARKATTARNLLAKMTRAPVFYPPLLARCVATFGLDNRYAIVACLRAYHALAYKATHGVSNARIDAAALEVDGASVAEAARLAARPVAGATADENARAAAGYARLLAAGAFD